MNKDYEDDGRTVADMSGIERRPVLFPGIGGRDNKQAPLSNSGGPGESHNKPGIAGEVSREERRYMIRGGLAAGLAVALAFALAFAAVILLIGHLSM